MRMYLDHGVLNGCAGVVLSPFFHLGLHEEIVCGRSAFWLVLLV